MAIGLGIKTRRTGLANKGIKKDKKVQAHIAGLARQKEYDKLSIQEKIQKLDDLLGVGVGAVKQRARLNGQLQKEKENAA